MKKPSAFAYKIAILVALLVGIFLLKLATSDLKTRYAYDKLEMLARFSAKEYCTCRFVHERSPEECLEYIDAYVPVFGKKLHTIWITKVSETEKNIAARTLFFVDAKAQFTSPEGCLLETKLPAKRLK